MPQNFYEVLWIFLIYAFLGWCAEVAYHALNMGVFINRGFLNGPLCPIYGFGVLIVITALYPIKENLILLFLGAFFLTSLLEYLTGAILKKIFNEQWWDYSHLPFNINGYICLKFSIYWGLGCIFIVDLFHPALYRWILLIPKTLGNLLLFLLSASLTIDLAVTVSTILSFKKRIKVLEDLAQKMRRLSDDIGEDILEKTTLALEKTEQFKNSRKEFPLKAGQLKTLQEEYQRRLQERHSGIDRLTKAYPNLKKLADKVKREHPFKK